MDRIVTTSEIIERQHAAHDRADTRLSTAGGTRTPRLPWLDTGRYSSLVTHCRSCGARYRQQDPAGCCLECGAVDA